VQNFKVSLEINPKLQFSTEITVRLASISVALYSDT